MEDDLLPIGLRRLPLLWWNKQRKTFDYSSIALHERVYSCRVFKILNVMFSLIVAIDIVTIYTQKKKTGNMCYRNCLFLNEVFSKSIWSYPLFKY